MEHNPEVRAVFPRIYEVVKQVPPGQVTTYGDVARIVGGCCDARVVGEAMAEVQDPEVPWHRVINAKGMISLRGANAVTQRRRLESEGVAFNERGQVSLKRFGWHGPDAEWAQQHGYHMLASADDPNQMRLF